MSASGSLDIHLRLNESGEPADQFKPPDNRPRHLIVSWRLCAFALSPPRINAKTQRRQDAKTATATPAMPASPPPVKREGLAAVRPIWLVRLRIYGTSQL